MKKKEYVVPKKQKIDVQLNMLIKKCAELTITINHIQQKKEKVDSLLKKCAEVSMLIEGIKYYYISEWGDLIEEAYESKKKTINI